jgi:beta-glucosidase
VAAPVASAPAARPWMYASLSPRARAELLLARMALEEKIGQMTQAERGAVTGDPSLIATWMLGSLLSGGGSTPTPNTPEAWADVDPVHGPGNVVGATVFPQHRPGATRDPRLVERIEHVTAEEIRATGPPVGVRALRVRGP